MQPFLLPTAYFPPVSWMAAAVQSGSIHIEIHETYPKQTLRNRCNIATSSGILSLTVPVKRINGSHTKTCDIQTDNSANWQQLHWRSIITAYSRTPYFIYYRDLFEPLFLKKKKLLVELNQEILSILIHALKIHNLVPAYTTVYETVPAFTDLRNSFHRWHHPYSGFNIEFPRYIQAFEEITGFLPDLSILDLIFNLGPDSLSYLETLRFSLWE